MKTFIIIHRYDGGDTPYRIKAEVENSRDLFKNLTGDEFSDSCEIENSIASRLNLNFDPNKGESLLVIEEDEIGDTITINF